MTTETKKELKLENLLDSHQFEFAYNTANKTIQYIKNEISTLESLRSLELRMKFQSQLGSRMTEVIDTNFMTPGFHSDYSNVQSDAFIQRAVYFERVLSELHNLTEKYEKDHFKKGLFDVLNAQKRRVLAYLMMTDAKNLVPDGQKDKSKKFYED